MEKRTKRLLGSLALAAAAVGAAGTYLKKSGSKKTGRMGTKQQRAAEKRKGVWARPGMIVTFRAELMPGRDREQRTARVKELLPSGRVTLNEVAGEHGQGEFDPIS